MRVSRLTWALCATCSAAEQRFMEASMAYTEGKGYLSDDEYDALKAELREQNSKVVQQVGSHRRCMHR